MPRRTTRQRAPRQPAAQTPPVPERSEEDILLQRELEVTLGGKPHKIKLLTIRSQAEWRKKVAPLFAAATARNAVDSDDPEAFRAALVSNLVDGPVELLDLFFDYAVDLQAKREWIETNATEGEVALAFQKIVAVALPDPLAMTLAKGVVRALG